MDLKLKDQFFIVGGASAGFGKAVAKVLLEEGAEVLLIARNEDKLKAVVAEYGKASYLVGDITREETLNLLFEKYGKRNWAGLLVNAGGPPAKYFMETTVEDWDEAYRSLLRWKMQLAQFAAKNMQKANYGRILFLESSTLKHPLQNLVLSNSLRMAVAAMAKTMSADLAPMGITVNVIAPGYHKTSAIERLLVKESETMGISEDEAQLKFEKAIPVGKMGNPDDFASLAAWLLSGKAKYVTGQVYTVDGGLVRFPL